MLKLSKVEITFIKKLSIRTQTGFGGAHNASLTNAGQEAKKGNDGTAGSGIAFGGATKPVTNSLSLGKDSPTTSAYTTGYNLFNNADDVDVSLILGSARYY